MKVILLSAGRGERLKPLTKEIPKCLIKISDKYTILSYQLKEIRKSGVKDILIVTGHIADKIEDTLSKSDKYSLNIKTIYNPFYYLTNNLVSLWLTTQYLDGDFTVINGDDIFEASVLSQLLNESKEGITMVVSVKERYSEEDMKVILKNGKVCRVGKEIDQEAANGESIGMICFKGKGAKTVRKTLDMMIRNQEFHQSFWLSAIQQIIDEQNVPVMYLEVSSNLWTEIDFHQDVDNAKRYVHEKVKDILD